MWRSASSLITTAQGPRLAMRSGDTRIRPTTQLLLDLCHGAGIAALLVPAPSARSGHTIAVDRGDAQALLTALADVDLPWYVAASTDGAAFTDERLLVHPATAALAQVDTIKVVGYTGRGSGAEPGGADTATVAFTTRQADRSREISRAGGRATLLPPGARKQLQVSVDGTVAHSVPAWPREVNLDPGLAVDVVYAWVDGDDAAWQRRRRSAAARSMTMPHGLPEGALETARFRCRDELRFSLRSVSIYAPWVRHIWLVTDRQIPPWLDRDAPGLTVVDHRELFAEHELPTFNSRAIETRLHTISGLTEHYLYFNDDVFLGRGVERNLFFASPTVSRFFPSKSTLSPRASRAGTSSLEGGRLLSQELISRRFGVTPLHLFRHAPYPQQRSLMYELAEIFPEAFARTAASAFRSGEDIVPATWIHHHGGYFLGRTAPSGIDYTYLSTSDLATRPEVLQRLGAHGSQAFCLNDAGPAKNDLTTSAVQCAMTALFPEPSRFELRQPPTHERDAGAAYAR